MPGKWSGLRGTLPPAPLENDYQNRVNVRKTELAHLSQTEKARQYITCRDNKDRLNEEISRLNLDIEALSQMLIPQMEQDGVDMFRLDSGESLSIKDEPYSSVDNRPMFLTWIRNQNLEDLLTVNYQTMNSMVKERLTKGLQAPPGIKVFLKQSITKRKGRE
jgi:hypothetical protein